MRGRSVVTLLARVSGSFAAGLDEHCPPLRWQGCQGFPGFRLCAGSVRGGACHLGSLEWWPALWLLRAFGPGGDAQSRVPGGCRAWSTPVLEPSPEGQGTVSFASAAAGFAGAAGPGERPDCRCSAPAVLKPSPERCGCVCVCEPGGPVEPPGPQFFKGPPNPRNVGECLVWPSLIPCLAAPAAASAAVLAVEAVALEDTALESLQREWAVSDVEPSLEKLGARRPRCVGLWERGQAVLRGHPALCSVPLFLGRALRGTAMWAPDVWRMRQAASRGHRAPDLRCHLFWSEP